MRTRAGFLGRIKGEESFSATSFWDDAPGGGGGQWTWGYGTKAPGPNEEITEEQASKDLLAEIEEAERDFLCIFPTDPPGITQTRYEALVDMLFNLGLSRFSEFHYTVAAVRSGDWIKAAAHAQQSLWYRQVGGRARRIVEELKTGYGKDEPREGIPATIPGEEEKPGCLPLVLGAIRKMFVVRTGG